MSISHVLLDLRLGDPEILKTVEPVRSVLREAVELSGARIVHAHFHQFHPHGFSGFFLIAESHVSVHTWVDESLMAIDILSCGSVDTSAIARYLRERLSPIEERITDVARG